MAENLPEDKVREFVYKRVEEEFAQRLEEQFFSKVEEVMQNVLSKLQDRGIDPESTNVDIVKIVRDIVIAELSSPRSNSKTAEIPVAGRTNSNSSKIALSQRDTSTTYVEEVPIEGGDVDNPDTMEIERTRPGPNPRFNQSPFEVSRSFREGLSTEQEIRLREPQRTNAEEEYDPEDIPVAGRSMGEDNE